VVAESFTLGGKSGLFRAAQGVTPLHRKVRTSGTERMSRSIDLFTGNGRWKGSKMEWKQLNSAQSKAK